MIRHHPLGHVVKPVFTATERIERNSIPEPNSGCWLWLGELSKNGYAKIAYMNRRMLAHRVSYEAYVAPIPSGLVIDHLCRNRACVNPLHLEPVTNRENLLRGVGFASKHAAKTHCPQGHAYDTGNIYLSSRGERHCRACIKLRGATKKARLRAQPI